MAASVEIRVTFHLTEYNFSEGEKSFETNLSLFVFYAISRKFEKCGKIIYDVTVTHAGA